MQSKKPIFNLSLTNFYFFIHLYGFGIWPVSAWLAKLATMSSNIWVLVLSCIFANFGAE